ncbi:undecaprenyldiphospho-muramoylpentapeptide beta-N-acetylglucosaminyltransferase [Brumimicrobium glaciale]|jgi:UDP-N-acetylglucosamine--N-acetylmuramyl-(pentapeptide) pyrophosphoryl-undecaprenol N-acetylglucosamine transferase|uniref:UDP-N-acetylglucosamine--N-acetylmuramyl-(pentapeptide) pyrophosphoryl-undecaprenol N-acetylglucosamine transferase n=1 Tax=Brumimicrobium glaciale TaxID=200475 RepID=A0A4Q4KGY7_9FLAO|nr:undecaprenyldiphospho-muramoylpentapeptide beta-N-acetylglucosaminyltransferase [Brumimicrobium glaciale]RYM32432.1 undecaprenyldiphospho-muramoylpentapeptide beta-N-acetylglucosaminyltransferase [Brumimicrobium glaciale]
MSIKKVIISGGGTGGHIFPAIAIANRIKKEYPEAEILFIGAEGRMEMTRVPAAGYKIVGLWISGFQRRITAKNLSLPFKVLASLMKARKIIKNFNPDVVIGVGGYASAPTLKIASMLNIPTIIQEQNSYPGKTNKFLSKKATKICVAYTGLEEFFPAHKIEITGNPVRAEVVQIEGLKDKGIAHFKLDPNKQTVLVVGGSLGAKTLNESFVDKIKLLQENNVQLIWQSGSYQYDEMLARTKDLDMTGIVLTKFINEMEMAYAVADIIISRAGAIAISELCIIGKPIVLVPSPHVAEDHQTKNAMALVKDNAAILIKDVEAREKLVPRLLELINNPEEQKELATNIQKKAIANADERIVNVIKSILA